MGNTIAASGHSVKHELQTDILRIACHDYVSKYHAASAGASAITLVQNSRTRCRDAPAGPFTDEWLKLRAYGVF
jgi:hypothetical protein